MQFVGKWNLARLNDVIVLFAQNPPSSHIEEVELFEYCSLYMKEYIRKYGKTIDYSDVEFIQSRISEEIYLRIMRKDLDKIQDLTVYLNSGVYKSWLFDALSEIGKTEDTKQPSSIYFNTYQLEKFAQSPQDKFIHNQFEDSSIHMVVDKAHKFLRYYDSWSRKEASINARITLNLSLKYLKFRPFRVYGEDQAMCRFVFNKCLVSIRRILSAPCDCAVSIKNYSDATLFELSDYEVKE